MNSFSLLLSGNEYSRVRSAAQDGNSVHAYIIKGQEGMGKTSLALLLSAALLCPNDRPPCFECSTCRRILAKEHPDVHIFKGAKKSISVSEMRKLSETSIESSYEGGKRVFIITNAHTMTVQAQNCLLKTLEEPSENAVFILLSTTDGLLPTINSRCRSITMSERSVKDISDQLVLLGVDRQDALNAAELSGGNIGKAIAIANGESRSAAAIARKLLAEADTGVLWRTASVLTDCQDMLPAVIANALTLLALRIEQDPSDLKSLIRIKELNDALMRIKSNINYGLLTDKLARGLISGETVWQR